MQKHAYPDQALVFSFGNGMGFERMRRIIHDFFSYNLHMERDLGEALNRILPASDLEMLRLIAQVAEAQGVPLYAVGGLPRDLVLGRIPSDFDLVVEGSAVALSEALVGEFGGTVTSHARFGTAQWHLGQSRTSWGSAGHPAAARKGRTLIDLISARRESYSHPAALPQVSPGSIEDDLRRRDFTINTLALRLDGLHYGELLDPLGGMRDLERRIIRALHEASFEDDPTRMLRAVRYEQRLGFRIDAKTMRMIRSGAAWLRQVSAHRVRQELDSALQEENAASMIRRMATLGLLRSIHPALPSDGACLKRLRVQLSEGVGRMSFTRETGDSSVRWLLWMLDLSPLQIRSIRRRLLFDNRMTTQILAASRFWHSRRALAGLRPSQLTRKLDEIPLISARAVALALPKSGLKTALQVYLAKWRTQRPLTTAADLGRLGIPAGPAYRELLQHLRAGWIDGSITSEAQERRALESWLKRARSRRKDGARSTPGSRRKLR